MWAHPKHRQRGFAFRQKHRCHVELTCEQPGAKVYLDGEVLFTAPGQYKGLVIVGEHTVLAKGDGFSPTQVSQKLAPRETMRLDVKLFTDDELTRYHRRMPVWLPYASSWLRNSASNNVKFCLSAAL